MPNPIRLDPDSATPLVVQLGNHLGGLIRRGQIRPGERLPTLRALVAQSGLSMVMVQQAVATLAAEGLVRRRQGSGVFAADPALAGRHLALLLPTLGPEHLGRLLAGIRVALGSDTAGLVLLAGGAEYERPEALLAALDRAGATGLIAYPPACGGDALAPLRAVVARGLPLVTAGPRHAILGVDAVAGDRHRAGGLAAELLLTRGHRAIALLDAAGDDDDAGALLAGLATALAAAGVPPARRQVADSMAIDLERPWAAGEAAATALLAAAPAPTALVAASPNLALGALRALHLRGLAPGRDVSLLAVGDHAAFPAMWPPVAAIADPVEEIGRQAAARLRQRIADPATTGPSTTLLLPPMAAVRASLAAAPPPMSSI